MAGLYRYRLLIGGHVEPIPDGKGKDEKGRSLTIKQGQVFASPNGFYATNWPEKFVLVESPTSGFTYNPKSGETLEQFNARVRQAMMEYEHEQEKERSVAQSAREGFDSLFEGTGQANPYQAQRQEQQPPADFTPRVDEEDTLEIMTVEELQQFAGKENIDLKGAKTKPALIKAIRAHSAKLQGAPG